MKQEIITLDGISSGFANTFYVDGKLKRGPLYRTFELAKLNNKRGGRGIVIVGGGRQILYECLFKKEGGEWEYIQNSISETKRLIFKETNNEIVTHIEYIIFENGDTERTDSSIGIKKSKEFFKIVKKSFEKLILKKKLRFMKKEKHVYVQVKNSTEKIHILYNSQIMDINMERRNEGIRCIPYEKCMDKFCTIFIYVTRDNDDTSESKYKEVLDDIITNLKENYSELNPKTKVVNFKGNIYE